MAEKVRAMAVRPHHILGRSLWSLRSWLRSAAAGALAARGNSRMPRIDWLQLRHGCIIAPNWLGDAIMSLPALRLLCEQTPDCDWTLLARPSVAPVYAFCEWPIRVLTIPAPGRGGRAALALAASRRLVRHAIPIRPEIAVVLPNSFYSGALCRATGARIQLGYARDGRRWLLTHAVAPPRPGDTPSHESFYYLELLRRAGLITALPERTEAVLLPDQAGIEVMRKRLHAEDAAAVVALHAGSSTHPAKRWLPERFAELAARLSAQGMLVVLIGSKAERDLAGEVLRRALGLRSGRSGPVGPTPINLAGETSLPEAIALLAAADLLVANDSGPMHLAGAVGTPVVAIFGPTNERETYPLSLPGRFRLIKAPGVECSPCKLRECPIDHRCMTRVQVDEVLEAVLEGLRHRGWQPVTASQK